MNEIELILPVRAELGEGMNLFPDGSMRWVDLPHGEIHILKEDSDRLVATLPHEVSKVLPWNRGMIVLGHLAVHFLNENGVEVDRVDLHDAASNLRCSDGMVLPNGEILFGILDRDLTPGRSRLVKIDHSHNVTEIVRGADISNGVAMLPDGERIVWVDSPRREIELFDFDPRSGDISGRRVHATLPPGHGLIDGLTTDADGGIWAALWAGSGIAHFDGSGGLVEIIEFAAPNVTSCAFDANDDLIITTGTATLDEATLARNPGAGGLWRFPQEAHGTHRLPSYVATI